MGGGYHLSTWAAPDGLAQYVHVYVCVSLPVCVSVFLYVYIYYVCISPLCMCMCLHLSLSLSYFVNAFVSFFFYVLQLENGPELRPLIFTFLFSSVIWWLF